jgi:lysyl-tRNA synthetase, class II
LTPRARTGTRRTATAFRRAGALATLLAGLLTIVSAVTANDPARSGVLLTVEPAPVIAIGHALAAMAGLGLIVLTRGVLEGKRRAVDAAIVLLLAAGVLHLVKGLDYEEGAVALAAAAMLAAGRRSFTRGCASRPGLVAGLVAVAAVAAAWILPMAYLIWSDRAEGLGRAVRQGAEALSSGGWWLRSGEPLAIVFDALVLTGVVSGALFLRDLLKPEACFEGHTAAEHVRARRLIQDHGQDSLAPFLLREDKSLFFGHGCVLAYRTLRETAVVSGDPVGPPGAVPKLLAAFHAYAERRGWQLAVTGASARHLAHYRELGLGALLVGEEAVVEVGGFSLEGRAIRKVRQSVARVGRHGWSAEVVSARDLEPEDARQIKLVESEWRAGQPRLYGFAMTMGRVGGAEEDEEAVYALGRKPDGGVGGFLRFVPYGGGLSLDAMRRASDTPNGLNEALVVATIEHARAAGLAELSLNFAGFSHLLAPARPLTARQRVMRFGLKLVHGRFQLERLVRFNEKFRPAWRGRYLVYGRTSELPRAGLRVLQAEAYLRPPRTAPMPARWRPIRDALPARTR